MKQPMKYESFRNEANGDGRLWDENVWYPSRDALDHDAWDGIVEEARAQSIVLPAVNRE